LMDSFSRKAGAEAKVKPMACADCTTNFPWSRASKPNDPDSALTVMLLLPSGETTWILCACETAQQRHSIERAKNTVFMEIMSE
ncbi:MAG: hypothetical protein ACK5C5_06525, partial [Bacteroidota bacterium]